MSYYVAVGKILPQSKQLNDANPFDSSGKTIIHMEWEQMSHYQTEQETFWTGEFGDEYIDRNSGE